jgi:IS5 family transposase
MASIHWPERSASAEWADRAVSRMEKSLPRRTDMKKFLAVISATVFLAGYLAMREAQAQYGAKPRRHRNRQHKFVRRYVVTDASVHDNQQFEDVLDTSSTASDVWADNAYRSQEFKEKLGRG